MPGKAGKSLKRRFSRLQRTAARDRPPVRRQTVHGGFVGQRSPLVNHGTVDGDRVTEHRKKKLRPIMERIKKAMDQVDTLPLLQAPLSQEQVEQLQGVLEAIGDTPEASGLVDHLWEKIADDTID